MNLQDEYKLIFFEIINGYSYSYHSYFNQLFIKHFSYLDLANFDIKYNQYLNEAKQNGILTYKEKENQIFEDGLWTEDNIIEYDLQEKMVKELKIGLSKDFLYSRREKLKKEIESAQIKLESLKLKKSFYIGEIAEDFANKKLIYDKVINCFYKDKECKELINSNDIDDDNYDELITSYYKLQERLSLDNVKKISLSSFFTNIFYLSQDNAYNFYGKPIVQLTNYQCDLYLMGKYFKNIISEHSEEIPKEIYNNPNDLMDWIEIYQNAKKAGIVGDENGTNEGSMSIVGATKKDLELLGLKPNSRFNLSDKLKEKGGKLDASDLYNLTK